MAIVSTPIFEKFFIARNSGQNERYAKNLSFCAENVWRADKPRTAEQKIVLYTKSIVIEQSMFAQTIEVKPYFSVVIQYWIEILPPVFEHSRTMLDDIALVLEGGGMRGVFTAGVLDAFLDEKFYFPYTVGVSAGSSNGLSYASRQRGRARFCNIDALSQYNYIGLKFLFTRRCIMDYDFLFSELPRNVYPYDFDAYLKSGVFKLVATNCTTGRAEYFEKPETFDSLLDACRASCSLPYVCPIAEIGGVPYLDGGLSEPIAVRCAELDGYKKFVFVLTRNAGFVKPTMYHPIAKLLYKKYPNLIKCIKTANLRYNETLAYAERLEREGRAVIIRPVRPLRVGRLERDVSRLSSLYDEGLRVCRDSLRRIAVL